MKSQDRKMRYLCWCIVVGTHLIKCPNAQSCTSYFIQTKRFFHRNAFSIQANSYFFFLKIQSRLFHQITHVIFNPIWLNKCTNSMRQRARPVFLCVKWLHLPNGFKINRFSMFFNAVKNPNNFKTYLRCVSRKNLHICTHAHSNCCLLVRTSVFRCTKCFVIFFWFLSSPTTSLKGK